MEYNSLIENLIKTIKNITLKIEKLLSEHNILFLFDSNTFYSLMTDYVFKKNHLNTTILEYLYNSYYWTLVAVINKQDFIEYANENWKDEIKNFNDEMEKFTLITF